MELLFQEIVIKSDVLHLSLVVLGVAIIVVSLLMLVSGLSKLAMAKDAVGHQLAEWIPDDSGRVKFLWKSGLAREVEIARHNERHYRQECDKLRAVVNELKSLKKSGGA